MSLNPESNTKAESKEIGSITSTSNAPEHDAVDPPSYLRKELDESMADDEQTANPDGSFITNESSADLHRIVWILAWPSVLAMMLQTVNSFLDRGFMGSLGPDVLAAVGVGSQFTFLLMTLGISISVGATALVARFTGAKDNLQAKIAANQALWIGVIVGLAAISLTYPIRGIIIHHMHLNATASALCFKYLSLCLIGTPALFVMLVLSGSYRGIGDTISPLVIGVIVNIIHLTGDYALIFGYFGAPKLGISGGGIALATSQWIGALIYLSVVNRSALRGMLTIKKRLDMEWAKRILNIGIPAAMQNLSRVLSMIAFTMILALSVDKTAAVAALTIGMTSESIAFMPGFGFATAASTLTGQNLGAHNPRRAERSAWISLQQGLIVMCIMGIIFFVFAAPFAHIFTKAPNVVRLTVFYLRISAISEPFLAFGMILTGALNGAGDTKAPAWAGVITMWLIRLPLAYLLAIAMKMGAVGAWWAMCASTMGGGIAALGLFKWGRWKHTRI